MQSNPYAKHGEIKSNSYGGRSVWNDDYDYFVKVPNFQLFSVAEAEKKMGPMPTNNAQQQHYVGVNQLSPGYDALAPKVNDRKNVSQEPIGYNPNRSFQPTIGPNNNSSSNSGSFNNSVLHHQLHHQQQQQMPPQQQQQPFYGGYNNGNFSNNNSNNGSYGNAPSNGSYQQHLLMQQAAYMQQQQQQQQGAIPDYAKAGVSPNTFALFNYKSGKSAEFIRSFSPISPSVISSNVNPNELATANNNNNLQPPFEIKKRNSSNFEPVAQDQDELEASNSYHDDFINIMGGMDGIIQKSPQRSIPNSPYNNDMQNYMTAQHETLANSLNSIDEYQLGGSSVQSTGSLLGHSLEENDTVVVATGSSVGSSSSPPHVEHPLGEHPSRTLFVRNISSNVEDDQLRDLFEAHGAIRSMYTQCKHRGFVMISYYDIRHAKAAMKNLQHKIINRRKIDIHYSIPKENPSEKDLNQGTLVVFNLDPSITNEELKKVFGKHGEIKEIRETPNKKHHKFIEFYDVRDAERAMKVLNKSDLRGKKIKIEPSRPGGARRNLMYSNIWAMEMANGTGSASTSTEPQQGSSPTNSSNVLANELNFAQAVSQQAPQQPQVQQQTFAQKLAQTPPIGSPIQQAAALNLGNNNGSNNSFAQYSPFQASYSQQQIVNSPTVMYSSQISLSSSMPSPSRFSALFNSHKQNASGNNSGNSGSIFSALPEHSIAAAVQPSASAAQNPAIITPPAAVPQAPAVAQGSSEPQAIAAAAAAVAVSQAMAAPASSPKQVVIEPSSSPAQKEPVRKNSRSGRNNNNDAKKQFQLDIEKVRTGIDVRTTLMIKNIPNKYTQKMLLQHIDANFKGTYDFFYLPIDFKNKCNVGYAFINFINPTSIIQFYAEFNSQKWAKFNSEKVCDITYARIQGKTALINHFQNSSLMVEDPACRPIFIL